MEADSVSGYYISRPCPSYPLIVYLVWKQAWWEYENIYEDWVVTSRTETPINRSSLQERIKNLLDRGHDASVSIEALAALIEAQEKDKIESDKL